MISVSLRKSEDPSRHYYIQVNVPSSDGHIPLLWFPVDTAFLKMHSAIRQQLLAVETVE